MQVLYLDDVQVIDALQATTPGQLEDVTKYSEQIVHVPIGKREHIAVVWAYFYYRVPMTRISYPPELRSYSSANAPIPLIENVETITDPVTGKAIGVEFDVTTSKAEAWIANVQAEATYFDEQMGREYTHRRTASFFLSSQRNIDEVLQQLTL